MTIQVTNHIEGVNPLGWTPNPFGVSTSGSGGIAIPCIDINVKIDPNVTATVQPGELLNFHTGSSHYAPNPVAGETYVHSTVKHKAAGNVSRILGYWCVALEQGTGGDTIQARFQGAAECFIYDASDDTIAAGTPLAVAANNESALSPVAGALLADVTTRYFAMVWGDALDTTDEDDQGSAGLHTVIFDGRGFGYATKDTLLDESNQ